MLGSLRDEIENGGFGDYFKPTGITQTISRVNQRGQITLVNPQPFSIVDVYFRFSQYDGYAGYNLIPLIATDTGDNFGCRSSLKLSRFENTPGIEMPFKILLSPFIGNTVVFDWDYYGRGVYATIKLTYNQIKK